MGIQSIVTPADLLKTEGVEPGWYPASIVSYDEATTKGSDEKPSDGSTNAIFEFELLEGTWKGRKFKQYFNEKNLHWGKELWAIIIPGFDRRKGGNLSSDAFKATVGKKLMVYVQKQKGGKYNEIKEYRPMAS